MTWNGIQIKLEKENITDRTQGRTKYTEHNKEQRTFYTHFHTALKR